LQLYWIDTSTNKLIWDLIADASEGIKRGFEKLLEQGSEIRLDWRTSFAESQRDGTLWCLLGNTGYLTVSNKVYQFSSLHATVQIPNEEAWSEVGSCLSFRRKRS
jgi:hypothetical protein